MCKEYINLQTNEVLDLERVSTLKDNAMLKVNPQLWCEWDFEKNDELGLDVWKITKGSGKKAWWKCKLGHKWGARLCDRNTGSNCPYCADQKVSKTNCLAVKNPQLASEWHPTKNGDLTANDVLCGTLREVWWLGKCGHEWKTRIRDRNRGYGCPYCRKHDVKLLKEVSDIWTTHPEIASLLLDKDVGYKHTRSSGMKVNWKCKCGNIIKNRKISEVCNNGLPCVNCSDRISYPEKFMYNVLRVLNVDFIKEASYNELNWCNGKRYDFYIPSLNMIIEVHGEQHYENGFKDVGGRTLEEEQLNDRIKRELAFKNGISRYIEIDCRKSEAEYIKNSILNSILPVFFDMENIDWRDIELKCNNSLMLEVIELWNSQTKKSVRELSLTMGLSTSTVRKYINRGVKCGLCEYDKIEARRGSIVRKIVQLSIEGEFIKEWGSIVNAAKGTGSNIKSIQCILKGNMVATNGYRWMYKEDYSDIEKLNAYLARKPINTQVVQLDRNFNLIKVWDNTRSITDSLNLCQTSINNCCNGNQSTAFGFIWMYIDKYEEFNNDEDKRLSYLKSVKQKSVIQLSLDGEFIKKWESVTEASASINSNSSRISRACRSVRKKTKGYKWMYERDYNKYIEEQNKLA